MASYKLRVLEDGVLLAKIGMSATDTFCLIVMMGELEDKYYGGMRAYFKEMCNAEKGDDAIDLCIRDKGLERLIEMARELARAEMGED